MMQTDASVLCLNGRERERWLETRWYVLYTRSRHEKAAQRELGKKGVETFLPVRRIMRNWSDRKKLIEEPLFKGYLFVQTPLIRRFDILNTFGIVNFVERRPHEPAQVPEAELFAIRRFMEADMVIDPFPYLKEGQRVYIRSGPFKGVEGFIVRKDTHCRLVISLDMLMQSVSVQLDQACVELAA